MGSLSYQVPAGLDIQDYLTFIPKAVVVSNYTPFYIYFPDSLSYCPPWTSGAIFPLAHATRARAIWTQSPFGPQVITVPAGVTYTASISFSDDELVLSGGTTLSNPFNAAQTLSGYGYLSPAGSYTIGTLPSGSTIRSATLSATNTSASNIITMVILYITDGISIVHLVGFVTNGSIPVQLSQLYVDPLTIALLSSSVATWSIYVYIASLQGVGSAAFWSSVVYN